MPLKRLLNTGYLIDSIYIQTLSQCPKGKGNEGPNRFKNTAKCKKETTECEPLDGYGFRRGGYQCRCRPSHRLPNVVRRPFLGEIIERASPKQYMNAFDCTKIGFIQRLPQQWVQAPTWTRDQYLEKYYDYRNYSSATIPNIDAFDKNNVDDILRFIWLVPQSILFSSISTMRRFSSKIVLHKNKILSIRPYCIYFLLF